MFVLDEVKDDPEFQKFLKTTVESSVETAVSDLKSKNSELIGEKRKLSEKLSTLDGIDPEAAKKALDFMSNNEIAKLISEGKTDEALSSYTEKIRANYEEKLSAVNEELNGTKKQADTFKIRFEQSVIDSEIRKEALKQGVLPDAIDDVLLRAKSVFVYGDDGSVEARDSQGNLVKVEDKLVTPATWIKNLPRHYWPPSDGVGATGGARTDAEAQLASAASNGDIDRYRKLRRKK